MTGIYDDCFPLGLGTNRFPLKAGASDEQIDECVRLVLRALELGVNYIDTGYFYSNDNAVKVLRRALPRAKTPYRLTLKAYPNVGDADGAVREGERVLELLDLSRASDFMIWSISSYSQLQEVMRPGGVYDGARRLKDEGVVDHIVCSVHAPVEETLKILDANVFPGMMLSMSAINFETMKPVLDRALEVGTGILVMNPLGGGFIPKRPEQYDFLRCDGEESVPQAALRFAGAHPAVKIVLSGAASVDELEENVRAFSEKATESGEERLERVRGQLPPAMEEFCTTCKYCEPCPSGIPTSLFMESRNFPLYAPGDPYNCMDAEAYWSITILKHLGEHGFFPDTPDNPCVRCGACEKKCTRGLHIMDSVADIYDRVARCSYSKAARRKRLDGLLNRKGYRKVGLWPGGKEMSDYIIAAYREFFGEPEFEFVYFKSRKAKAGEAGDTPIYSFDDIPVVKPDCILVISYVYGDEIVKDLDPYREQGVDIIKLHGEHDVPWVF